MTGFAVGDRIRGTHPYCYRSGEWATIVMSDNRLSDGRPCWLVQFDGGATDVWPQVDPVAGYERESRP